MLMVGCEATFMQKPFEKQERTATTTSKAKQITDDNDFTLVKSTKTV